jgi:hypothetical protein
MRKKAVSLFFIFLFCFSSFLFSQRSFDEVFPSLDGELRGRVFSSEGYFASYEENYRLLDAPGLEPHVRSGLNGLKPPVVIECLAVIPYPSSGPMESVDIYNAIRHIRALKGRRYHSHTRGEDVPLFEDATRIAGARKNSALDDPPSRNELPESETIYIRLRDANFGNSFYRADIQRSARGFTYNLSNNRDLSYLIFPVIKSGEFTAHFYFEPIAEGVLIYCLSGAKVSDFIASRVDMPSAIQKRLALIMGWAADCVGGRL